MVLWFYLSFTLLAIGQITSSDSFILRSAKLLETHLPILGIHDEILERETAYRIDCEFHSIDLGDSNKIRNTENKIRDAENWKINANGKSMKPTGIIWVSDKHPELVTLHGPFGGKDNLTVAFLNGEAVVVDIDAATAGKTKWGFGVGKAIDLSVCRLAEQKAFWACDYDFKVNILERNLATPKRNIWFRSLSLSVISNGTIASDDQVRNGAQHSIEITANSFYFVGGFIYSGELLFGYQLETKMDDTNEDLFDIIGKRMKLGLEVEIPFTHYPIYKLHTKVPYARVAMPLTLSLCYLFRGEEADGNDAQARLDFRARYELAFSPYLIVQGEWHGAKFFDAPVDSYETASYYSVAFAQDLDVVKETLGFLKFFLGAEEKIRGKNFVFFKISNGRKPPAFEDISEKSIGFAFYF